MGVDENDIYIFFFRQLVGTYGVDENDKSQKLETKLTWSQCDATKIIYLKIIPFHDHNLNIKKIIQGV